MQLRVILIVAADAAPVGDDGDTELAQILGRADARAQQHSRRMNATRRNDDLARCDCFLYARALDDEFRSRAGRRSRMRSTRVSHRISRFGRALASAVR